MEPGFGDGLLAVGPDRAGHLRIVEATQIPLADVIEPTGESVRSGRHIAVSIISRDRTQGLNGKGQLCVRVLRGRCVGDGGGAADAVLDRRYERTRSAHRKPCPRVAATTIVTSQI